MKPLVPICIVFVAAMASGIALGLSGWQSASLMAKVDLAVAVFFGGMFLFIMWQWNRTKPDSPDQKFMSSMMMLSAALLLGAMPRVVWPEGGWPRTVASILALCVTVAILIRLRRQSRKLPVT